MSGWNFAEVFEVFAEVLPDAQAQVHGGRRTTWAEHDRRADGVAAALLDAGLGHQDRVALYLHNDIEYLESFTACAKAALMPVNTNWRYVDEELAFLWSDAGASAVVFHGAFVERAEAVRHRLHHVRAWVWVDDGSGPCPPWATPYEEAAAAAVGRTTPAWGRSPDDLILLYTGGTTGRPKGVMWRQHDLFAIIDAGSGRPYRTPGDPAAVRAVLERPGLVGLPACPLVHGTGLMTSLTTMHGCGSIVTLVGRRLDVVELLDTVERERVQTIAIVGDPFARPMLEALDAEPDRWDLSALRTIVSAGAMWSEATKRGLLAHLPRLKLADLLGSSEAIGVGASVSSEEAGATGAGRFALGPSTRVLDDHDRDVEPGSGTIGRLAIRGHTPVGYWNDPVKTADTWVEIHGHRYTITGDWALVEPDGTVVLLGRGSACINTAGEKVFPEEVEEAVKDHPAVRDAAVVGLPDDRFGEAVTALVEPTGDERPPDAELADRVRARLAGYKVPRRWLWVDTVGRAPNGKLDYRALRVRAAAELGVALPG